MIFVISAGRRRTDARRALARSHAAAEGAQAEALLATGRLIGGLIETFIVLGDAIGFFGLLLVNLALWGLGGKWRILAAAGAAACADRRRQWPRPRWLPARLPGFILFVAWMAAMGVAMLRARPAAWTAADGRFEAATYRKVAWRLLPLLFVGYFLAMVDRVNVGFAKLQMASDLELSDAVYGFGAGIFFVGYFLFEFPSNLIQVRVGARRWLARIMVTWGLISAGFMFTGSVAWGGVARGVRHDRCRVHLLRAAFPARGGRGGVRARRASVPDAVVPGGAAEPRDRAVLPRDPDQQRDRQPDLGGDPRVPRRFPWIARMAMAVRARGRADGAVRLRVPAPAARRARQGTVAGRWRSVR